MPTNVLNQALDAARRPRAVVAFDLDSTLIDNRPRQAAIVREFARSKGIVELLDTRPEHWTSWDLIEAMSNAGLARARAADLHEEARAFWWDRFFHGDYCRWDIPLPGAPEFVRAVAKSGAILAYVTGRHERMRPGTVASLGRGGFPLPTAGAAIHLLMKPELRDNDDEWKADAQHALEGLGEVVAAFDNEPAHCNAYRNHWPRAIVVRIRTDHSGRDIPLLDGIVSIDGFA